MPRKSKRVLIISEYKDDPQFSLSIQGPVSYRQTRGKEAQFVVLVDHIDNYTEDNIKFIKTCLKNGNMGYVMNGDIKEELVDDQRVITHNFVLAGGLVELFNIAWTDLKWF